MKHIYSDVLGKALIREGLCDERTALLTIDLEPGTIISLTTKRYLTASEIAALGRACASAAESLQGRDTQGGQSGPEKVSHIDLPAGDDSPEGSPIVESFSITESTL